MKKSLAVILSITLLLCSCSKSDYIEGAVVPTDIISKEDVSAYTGITPKISEESNRREAKASYVSDKLGNGDNVYVSIVQENGLMTKDKIKEYFDECKNMRADSIDVKELGVKAYIAYPSIHYYVDGFHVTITAGSGNDDAQKSLLINLAKVSLKHLAEKKNVDYKDAEK